MNMVRDKYANCLENVYLNLINENGLNNEKVIYSFSWDFGYISQNGKYLYERLSNTKDINKQLIFLKKYFGICINWITKLEVVPEFIEKEKQIIFCMDSFWCPWTKAYKSDHIPHYFVIKGKKGKIVYCQDYYFNLHHQEIRLDQLMRGCIKIGIISKAKKEFYDYEKIFRESINNVKFSYSGAGDFSMIRELAEEIRNSSDLQATIGNGQKNIENSKVLLAVHHISNGRNKYIMHWENYKNRTGSNVIRFVTDELLRVTGLWKKIQSVMIRCCLEDQTRDKVIRLYDYLMQVSYEEESIADNAYRRLCAACGDNRE